MKRGLPIPSIILSHNYNPQNEAFIFVKRSVSWIAPLPLGGVIDQGSNSKRTGFEDRPNSVLLLVCSA